MAKWTQQQKLVINQVFIHTFVHTCKFVKSVLGTEYFLNAIYNYDFPSYLKIHKIYMIVLIAFNFSMFFDACDGIFLNYNWKDETLHNSLKLAREKGRDMDVYVGIDVFGRGCLGGGGFNTVEVSGYGFQCPKRFSK